MNRGYKVLVNTERSFGTLSDMSLQFSKRFYYISVPDNVRLNKDISTPTKLSKNV